MRVRSLLIGTVLAVAWVAAPVARAQVVPRVQTTAAGSAAPVQFPDTIVTRTVAPEAGWFDRVTSLATGLMTISILVLTIALVPAAWSFRKSHKTIRLMLDRVHNDILPLMRHASTIADNVNYITTSIRVDVQQVNQTIASANRRILNAVGKAEDRINELNALITVAQEEAESAFISTASALRGISTGAATLAAGGRGRRRSQRMEATESAEPDDELDEAVEGVDAALDAFLEQEDSVDGNDKGGTTDGGSEAPRVRSRGRPGSRA